MDWGTRGGESVGDSPCEGIYPGTQPLSETESWSLNRLMEQEQFTALVDLHAYKQLVRLCFEWFWVFAVPAAHCLADSSSGVPWLCPRSFHPCICRGVLPNALTGLCARARCCLRGRTRTKPPRTRSSWTAWCVQLLQAPWPRRTQPMRVPITLFITNQRK